MPPLPSIRPAPLVVQEPAKWDQAQSDAVDAVQIGVGSEGRTVLIRSSLTRQRTAVTPLAFVGFIRDVRAGRFDKYLPPD